MVVSKIIKKEMFRKEEELLLIKANLKNLGEKIHTSNIEFFKVLERFQRHEKDFYTWIQTITSELEKRQ